MSVFSIIVGNKKSVCLGLVMKGLTSHQKPSNRFHIYITELEITALHAELAA
jgi:hypothetical protein